MVPPPPRSGHNLTPLPPSSSDEGRFVALEGAVARLQQDVEKAGQQVDSVEKISSRNIQEARQSFGDSLQTLTLKVAAMEENVKRLVPLADEAIQFRGSWKVLMGLVAFCGVVVSPIVTAGIMWVLTHR